MRRLEYLVTLRNLHPPAPQIRGLGEQRAATRQPAPVMKDSPGQCMHSGPPRAASIPELVFLQNTQLLLSHRKRLAITERLELAQVYS